MYQGLIGAGAVPRGRYAVGSGLSGSPPSGLEAFSRALLPGTTSLSWATPGAYRRAVLSGCQTCWLHLKHCTYIYKYCTVCPGFQSALAPPRSRPRKGPGGTTVIAASQRAPWSASAPDGKHTQRAAQIPGHSPLGGPLIPRTGYFWFFCCAPLGVCWCFLSGCVSFGVLRVKKNIYIN